MHAPSSPVTLMQLNLKNLRLACGVFFGDEDMIGLGEQRDRGGGCPVVNTNRNRGLRLLVL